MTTSKASVQHRVRERRRVAFSAGLGMMLATAAAGIALGTVGSGCIFDQGSYEGGGRRSTAPTSEEDDIPLDIPTSTSTSTSTSTPAPDSGPQVPDADTPDA